MIHAIRRTILPIVLAALATSAAHAQYYKQLYSLKGGSISAGYTGQFTTTVTSDATPFTSLITTPVGTIRETSSGQQQFTPETGGLLLSVQLHPVPFAGIELNYGHFRSSEIYNFNYSTLTAPQTVRFPVTTNEATAAYEFHPKHIPLQPFVNVGGGAISFLPRDASSQWRATGLVEAGLDLPTGNKHIAIRIEGRSLIYRAPNFNQPALSSRSWRVTDEPVAAVVYRF